MAETITVRIPPFCECDSGATVEITKPTFFYRLKATCNDCKMVAEFILCLDWLDTDMKPSAKLLDQKPAQVFSREVTPYDLEAFAKMGWKGPLFCED